MENEEIKLDSVFKFSLIQDLVRVRSLDPSNTNLAQTKLPVCRRFVHKCTVLKICEKYAINFSPSNQKFWQSQSGSCGTITGVQNEGVMR